MDLLIYLGIAGFGMLLIALSFLFGGDHDGDAADGDDDSGADDGDGHHGLDLRWLSIKTVAGFTLGFGAVGSIAKTSTRLPEAWVLALAAAFGLVMVFVMRMLMQFFVHQQASSTYSIDQAIGKIGTVTQMVPPGQWGQVAVRMGAELVQKPAQSEDATLTIRPGAKVTIMAVSGPGLVVKLNQEK